MDQNWNQADWFRPSKLMNNKRANDLTVAVRLELRRHRQGYPQIFLKRKYRQINHLQTSEPDLHRTWSFPKLSKQLQVQRCAKYFMRGMGTSKYYLTACPLPQTHYLRQITPNNEELWHKQLASSKYIQYKSKAVIRWLTENTDTISL